MTQDEFDALVKSRPANGDKKGLNLRGADLRGLFMAGMALDNSNLRNTDLRGATLYCSQLKYSNLSGADLRGADLRGAGFYRTVLHGSLIDEATRFGLTMYCPLAGKWRLVTDDDGRVIRAEKRSNV